MSEIVTYNAADFIRIQQELAAENATLRAQLKEAKQLVTLAEKIALDAHEKKEAAEAAAIKAESELQEARETMKMKKAAFDIAFGDG